MHRAGAAHSYAAAVFGTLQVEVVTQDPEHGGGGVHVHPMGFAVDFQIKFGHRCDSLNAQIYSAFLGETLIFQTIGYENQTVPTNVQ
jgi:hypothetical protein